MRLLQRPSLDGIGARAGWHGILYAGGNGGERKVAGAVGSHEPRTSLAELFELIVSVSLVDWLRLFLLLILPSIITNSIRII